MKCLATKYVFGVSMILRIASLAVAIGPKGCESDMSNGQYAFTAAGFSSATDGSWFHKAIIEYLALKGDGTLSIPAATVANHANDGAVVQSPPGGVGAHSAADDRTGTFQFTNAQASTSSSCGR